MRKFFFTSLILMSPAWCMHEHPKRGTKRRAETETEQLRLSRKACDVISQTLVGLLTSAQRPTPEAACYKRAFEDFFKSCDNPKYSIRSKPVLALLTQLRLVRPEENKIPEYIRRPLKEFCVDKEFVQKIFEYRARLDISDDEF